MPPKLKVDEELIIQKYEELRNIYLVGDLFNISSTSVSKILKRNNFEFGQRRYFVNQNYFDVIDSEEKSYWYGFLCADGYIRERKSGNSLEMKLGIRDLEHLELFKKHINSTHNIRIGESTTTGKKGTKHTCTMAHLAIYSLTLVESIKKQGFHSRKTFTIGKPKFDKKFYRHFIRGYFDGDGCCYVKRTGTSLDCRFTFACASDVLRNFISDELRNHSIETSNDRTLNIYARTVLDSSKIFNYMYDGATIYLKRKKEKGDEFMEYMDMKKNKGIYCYQDTYIRIERIWLDEEIEIVKKYINKIPITYLSYSILPNKSPKQILRLCKKMGIKNDKKMSRKDYEKYCEENNIIPYLNK